MSEKQTITLDPGDVAVVFAKSLLPNEATGLPSVIRARNNYEFDAGGEFKGADGKTGYRLPKIQVAGKRTYADACGVKIEFNMEALLPHLYGRKQQGATATATTATATQTPRDKALQLAGALQSGGLDADDTAFTATALVACLVTLTAATPAMSERVMALAADPKALAAKVVSWGNAGLI